ncbi:MAG TPA: S41 family peptidase, partial [Bacteroidales bacterium]|nr:S41 family peptidase [Bacteroidales bacterium]
MLNSSRTRIVAYLPIIIALAVIAGMMLGSRLMRVSQVTQETPAVFFAPRFDKTSDVMLYILEDYVNPVSKLDLEKEAVLGMLKSLDPHSQYIPREDFDEVVDPLLGAFEGIGIQFRMERDSCTVIHTIPGGPSEKAGVIAGDRIIIINDSTVAGVGIRDRDIVRKLRGSKGSQVNVSVYRRGFRDLITFTITRDVIPTYSVDVAWMADEETGYIRLSKFSATTHQELVEAIRNLKNQGMQRLIFDLRGNSGGILQAAISVADEFLDKNRLIVYTEGHNRPRQYSFATEQGGFTTPPLVVLIDESSASASEIIAGA